MFHFFFLQISLLPPRIECTRRPFPGSSTGTPSVAARDYSPKIYNLFFKSSFSKKNLDYFLLDFSFENSILGKNIKKSSYLYFILFRDVFFLIKKWYSQDLLPHWDPWRRCPWALSARVGCWRFPVWPLQTRRFAPWLMPRSGASLPLAHQPDIFCFLLWRKNIFSTFPAFFKSRHFNDLL